MDEKEWREKFAARVKEKAGVDDRYAQECAAAAEYDPEWTPEDSADEEMSYWGE